MTVQVSDNGYPPRSNTTTVNIDVSDINDNPPLFSKENYSIIIQVIDRYYILAFDVFCLFSILLESFYL